MRRAADLVLLMAAPIFLWGAWEVSLVVEKASCEMSAQAACAGGAEPKVAYRRTGPISTCSVSCPDSGRDGERLR